VSDNFDVGERDTIVRIPLTSGGNLVVELENAQCYHGSIDMRDCPLLEFNWDAIFQPAEPVPFDMDTVQHQLHGTLRFKAPLPLINADGTCNWSNHGDE
jgi:hypothetical protein